MTIAEAIFKDAQNQTSAFSDAEHHDDLVETNQNWKKEQTSFTFSDDSVLVFSGPEFWVK